MGKKSPDSISNSLEKLKTSAKDSESKPSDDKGADGSKSNLEGQAPQDASQKSPVENTSSEQSSANDQQSSVENKSASPKTSEKGGDSDSSQTNSQNNVSDPSSSGETKKEKSKSGFEVPDFSEDDLNINLDVDEFLPPKDQYDGDEGNQKSKAQVSNDDNASLEGLNAGGGNASSSESESSQENDFTSDAQVEKEDESSKKKEDVSDEEISEEKKKSENNLDTDDADDEEMESIVSKDDLANDSEDGEDSDVKNEDGEFKLDAFDLDGSNEDGELPTFHFKELFISDTDFLRAIGLTKSMVSVAQQDNQLIESLEALHERESETYQGIREDTKEAIKGLVEIDKKLFGEVNK